MSYVVGVIGPTGSGKTVLCHYFEEQGCPVIYCDLLAREVLTLPDCIAQLVECFGDEILHNKAINRTALATIAFADVISTEKLNRITHHFITKEINKLLDEYSKKAIVLLDAPLLIEANLQYLCNKIIAVIANKDLRLNRIKIRDNITDEYANLRILAQKDDEFYINNSDIYIYNNGCENEFLEYILNIENFIKGEAY